MVSGAVSTLSALWSAFVLISSATLLPVIFRLFSEQNFDSILLAWTILVFLLVLTGVSKMTNISISGTLKIRYENIDLLEAVEKQKNEAIEANKDKSRFLSAASHDLRQPVHSLSLLTSAIEPEISSHKGRKILSQIEKANGVMLDLLNSLLDISKLDAEIVDVQLEVVNTQTIITKVMGEFRLMAEKNNLELCSHCSSHFIESDPVLLENIVRNLLQNAIRYTNKGKVLLSCRRQRNMILIQVWDTGRGIAPEHQDLVFVEFQQLQNPERDQNKGLGLGLAICHRLSILIGATIGLKSQLGKGSVFTLKIPALSKSRVDRHLSTKQEVITIEKPINFEQAVVLIIDDNEVVLDAMSSLLEGWGCKVLTADSIEATIQIAKSYQGHIDAIIADYRLRENTTGIEAMDAFHEVVDYQTARVVITGDTAPDRMQKIVAHGIPVLHKPIKSAHLKTALGSMLRKGIDT
jgi:signal transduction histidine kinase/CheY-like chemotaxis protein